MTSFSQWYESFSKDPKIKNLTLIYGVERILVEDVVARIKAELAPEPWNFVVYDGAVDTNRRIWNDVRQYPMGIKAKRLVLIWNAELLDATQMDHYIEDKRQFPDNYVIMVSNDADLPRVPVEGNPRGELPAHLQKMKTRGQLIHCRPFTSSTARYAVRWVQESARISSQVAAHLLNRANGDLRLVRDVVTKLRVFPDAITLTTVNSMLEERPKDTFINALFSLDRKTALKSLNELPRSEWPRTLGLIDARLELAGYVHDRQIEHKTAGEIARGAGNKSFLVPDILPVAKYYDNKRRMKIRELLSAIDEYTPTGIPNGALEVLVAFW